MSSDISKFIMKNLASSMVNDLVGPKGNAQGISNVVNQGMSKSFGEDWGILPVTGPKMMALVFILNSVLASQGITPKTIAEVASRKAQEMNLNEHVISFLDKVKISNTLSKEDLKASASAFGEQAKDQVKGLVDLIDTEGIWSKVSSVGESVGEIGEKGFHGAKSLGKSIKKGIFGKKDEDVPET